MSKDVTSFIIKYMVYKYELGSAKTLTPQKTDCYRMLIDLAEHNDFKIPTSFGEYNIDNYAEKYLEDQEATSVALCDFIRSCFVPRPLEERKYGDIILLENQDCKSWGIFLGTGNIMIVDSEAVRVVFEKLTFTITGCFECQLQSQ